MTWGSSGLTAKSSKDGCERTSQVWRSSLTMNRAAGGVGPEHQAVGRLQRVEVHLSQQRRLLPAATPITAAHETQQWWCVGSLEAFVSKIRMPAGYEVAGPRHGEPHEVMPAFADSLRRAPSTARNNPVWVAM